RRGCGRGEARLTDNAQDIDGRSHREGGLIPRRQTGALSVLLGFVLLGFVLLGFVLLGFVLLGFVLLGFVLLGFVFRGLVLLVFVLLGLVFRGGTGVLFLFVLLLRAASRGEADAQCEQHDQRAQ